MQKLLIYILFFFFILSCDDVAPTQDNPLDPGNEDYVEPSISFLSELNNGDIIFSAGMYFYALQAKDFIQIKKMVLLK